MDEFARQLLARMDAMQAELSALRVEAKSSGKTLREVYELDEATWSTQKWAPSMRSSLKPALAHFEGRLADSITRSEWIHFRDHVRAKQTTNRKGPPTPFTLNQDMGRWRTIYRRQLEEGNCATNPLEGIRPVRGAKKHRETEPTVADASAIRSHCDAVTWAFVVLAFQRGFRASEARRLEWRQVDLQGRRITLYASQDKTRRPHVLRITSDVVDALRAIKPQLPGRYVFQSPRTGMPYDPATMWRKFRAAADAAGLVAAEGDGRMVYHDLRHGFMSRATRRHGVPVAMRLSRHTSLASAQRYIHVDDRDLEQAYERMEDDVRRGPQTQQTADSNTERPSNSAQPLGNSSATKK